MLAENEGDLLLWVASFTPDLGAAVDARADHRARHARPRLSQPPAVFIPGRHAGRRPCGRDWSAATTSCRCRFEDLASLASCRARPTCSPPSKQPCERERAAHDDQAHRRQESTIPPTASTARCATSTSATGASSPPAPEARIDAGIRRCTGRVVMAGAIDLHTHIGGGKVKIARTLLPEDHAATMVARTALTRVRQRPCAALDPGHRLPLRRDGLHRLLRAGDAAGQRAPGAHGDGRHADRRQRRLRDARQRRLPAAAHLREEGRSRRSTTTSPGPCTPPRRSRVKVVNPGRHQRLQVQPAQARPRRAARPLRHHAARHHADAGARRCTSSASPHPAARPRLQPRRARQRRRPRSPPSARPKACRCT